MVDACRLASPQPAEQFDGAAAALRLSLLPGLREVPPERDGGGYVIEGQRPPLPVSPNIREATPEAYAAGFVVGGQRGPAGSKP